MIAIERSAIEMRSPAVSSMSSSRGGGSGVNLGGEPEQLVGGVAHCRRDDADTAARCGIHHSAGHGLDLLGASERAAAVLLDDEGYRIRSRLIMRQDDRPVYGLGSASRKLVEVAIARDRGAYRGRVFGLAFLDQVCQPPRFQELGDELRIGCLPSCFLGRRVAALTEQPLDQPIDSGSASSANRSAGARAPAIRSPIRDDQDRIRPQKHDARDRPL
jgi:hypothetical protein